MTFKRIAGKIHLWLGLASGLVVFIVSLTGCIYVFQEEIQAATQPYRFVANPAHTVLPPSVLAANAEAHLPDKPARRVCYHPAGRATEVLFYGAPDYYYTVYVNPHDGDVLRVKNMATDFFNIIFYLHYQLLLPPEIGRNIVSYSTLIFVVMLVSGLVLWWPRTKNTNAVKQRFTIKWSARWPRKNYDLHNVLGFYVTWLAIFVALTGLVFGFEWFQKSVYWTVSGGKSMPEHYHPHSDTLNVHIGYKPTATDSLWRQIVAGNPGAPQNGVFFPDEAQAPITVFIKPEAGTYYAMDYHYFDQYTLHELHSETVYGKYREASLADKIIRMNYDIHTGAILGFPGKVLAFFASLVAASLPVTGFFVWYQRGRGKRKREPAAIQRTTNVLNYSITEKRIL